MFHFGFHFLWKVKNRCCYVDFVDPALSNSALLKYSRKFPSHDSPRFIELQHDVHICGHSLCVYAFKPPFVFSDAYHIGHSF